MEIFGTNVNVTLGSWRLCFRLAVEDVEDERQLAKPPHRVRIVPDDTRVHHNAN